MLDVKAEIDSYRHLDVTKVHMHKVCPSSNHQIAKFNTDHGAYYCDKCDINVEEGRVMYGSRKCNYDLCEKCVYRQLNYKVELISYKP